MKRHELKAKREELSTKLESLSAEQRRVSKSRSETEKAIEEIDRALEMTSNQALVEFIHDYPQVIDVLAPTHTSRDCHDDSLHAVGRCPRCSLLVTKINGYVENFTWEFSTKYSR